MTSIIFVRHGESESNVFIHENPNDTNLSEKINALGDPNLSELGHKQASDVGDYLCKQLDGQKVRILVSPLNRTHETSAPFKKKYEGHVDVFEPLLILQEYTKREKKLTQEHLDKGIIHHKSWDDFTDTVKNFVNFLEELAQEKDDPIIIFGHSLFLSAMISYIGSSQTFMPKKEQLHFRFPNCSITTMEYSQGLWRIFNVASVAHLQKEHITGTECPFGHPK